MEDKNFFLKRYSELGHSLKGNEKTRKALRVNTLKISSVKLVEKLESLGVRLSEIEFVKDGFYIDRSPFSLGASFEYLMGFITMQEAAAQFPVLVLSPEEKDNVLDMCAAPGGKTTQIASFMKNKGVIVAIDKKKDRVYALENNLERSGVKNTVVYCMDVRTFVSEGILFDKILLDAPCSGNFMIDGDWFEKRDLEGIEKSAEMQKELIRKGISLLKKGGVMVYATCSLEPEENELNMQWMLENFDVKLEKIEGPGSEGLTEVLGKKLKPEISKCRRFWPDEMKTQGFFIAKIRK